jgi:polyisoprenoid-binding protein YceI
MKKIFWILAILIIAMGSFYFYITRPVPVSDQNVREVTGKLRPLTNRTTVYRIGEGSKVEFQINELLNGKPKLVIGTSTEIAGDVAVTDGTIQFGEMKLDARTLITDNSNRNGAINRLILKTTKAGNEYITVKPISTDFTGRLQEGVSATFNLTADLTISGITKLARFRVNMMVSNGQITGTAETKIKRSDFKLNIPNLSFIANVDAEFPVIITVVAEKVAE